MTRSNSTSIRYQTFRLVECASGRYRLSLRVICGGGGASGLCNDYPHTLHSHLTHAAILSLHLSLFKTHNSGLTIMTTLTTGRSCGDYDHFDHGSTSNSTSVTTPSPASYGPSPCAAVCRVLTPRTGHASSPPPAIPHLPCRLRPYSNYRFETAISFLPLASPSSFLPPLSSQQRFDLCTVQLC